MNPFFDSTFFLEFVILLFLVSKYFIVLVLKLLISLKTPY